MARIQFATKGGTLEQLYSVITKARILPQLRLNAMGCLDGLEQTVFLIQNHFKEHGYLAVRSSTTNEDSLHTSNAGHYRSLLNVSTSDGNNIGAAIRQVISSYDSLVSDDEILIQPMLTSITMSGVVMTADMDTLAPYYVINYDESGQADAITSGTTDYARTFIRFKDSPLPCHLPEIEQICNAASELEEIFGNHCIDIEFAYSGNDLYILQVRPIVTDGKEDLSQVKLKNTLLKIERKIEKLAAPHPNLLGDRCIFGVMPDWNPAEIIGVKPKQLALTLYKELITDTIWAYQRDNYGYRNLRSHPLLVSFLGVPYIDVRVDFNSFIPKSLDEGIARKLVDYYLTKLNSFPNLHDKIEFEIIFSCYYLNLPEKLTLLENHGFNRNELRRIEYSLLDLTNNIIDPAVGIYQKDIEKVAELTVRHRKIMDSGLSHIDKIYWLMEDCKRYGTLPFAGIARAGFIAVQFLKSFVESGVMTEIDFNDFMNSLNTVTTSLNVSFQNLANGTITRDEFLGEFGHLRPGTYDIQSLRYDENFDCYFASFNQSEGERYPFSFSDDQMRMIDRLLVENGIRIDASGLVRFLVEAIEGRERSKFIFTKTLSDIINLIVELGSRYGVSRDDLAYMDVKSILKLYASLDHRDLKEILLEDVAVNKALYRHTKAVRLPSLIRTSHDIYGFSLDPGTPNFITQKGIIANVCLEESIANGGLTGKIIFIKSADPGYDFLFTKGIAGLITQFGGANSHMAIRCAEVGLPAVIGAGEKLFARWSKAKSLEINCANQLVRVLT